MRNYRDTLNLPRTDFPMKADLPEREPHHLARWEEERIYARMVEARAGGPRYVLHDGPPYANGRLHLGTILNKILKDIVVKFKNMSGFCCEFIPGWDCHGLPIELEVDRKLGAAKRTMAPVDFRRACREYAEQFVEIQRAEFKRMGVLGRWEKPYLTMSPDYEATIAREFGKFVAKGSVYKGKKPIFWCASCRTALAEAEVEYADHASPSIYVKFQLQGDLPFRKAWGLADEPIFLVIWTTTPWTIPANLAIALHPDLPYVAVRVDGEVWIVAEGLLDAVMEAVGRKPSGIVGKPKAGELEHSRCRHPLLPRDSLVILGEHVTLEAGTGAVHTAPGHGQEDYDIGRRYGLEVLAPVDDAGLFTSEAGLPWLTGVFVEKANPLIVEKLSEAGALVKSQEILHSYPHCWRCKKPIIFRSTDQWFISMEEGDLRQRALAAIPGVQWIPPWGEKRIAGMVAARPDWCVSRQRLWGVPVVALVCESCDTSHTTPELVLRAAELFEREGADAWYARPAADFLSEGFACPSCGERKRFGKEPDILDVWFDSGVSYAAVMEGQERFCDPVDLYLEGSDQHRGWFHTALLASVGTRGRAPYRRVLTHGFVVDGEGKKYSKSARNYVHPERLIGQHGAEILRLWVASEDYRDDIRFSDEILTRCVESYRKQRNTARFILGNLFDFDPERDLLPDGELLEIDRWALAEFARFSKRTLAAYEQFDFHLVVQGFVRLCSVELSAFYFDVLKDRLYAERASGRERRSAQTALWRILDGMVRLSAPILSFTADEIWRAMPRRKEALGCVFLESLPSAAPSDEALLTRWERLRGIRAVVTKALEIARAEKLIGNSLAARVVIECGEEPKAFLEGFGEGLADLFIVSGVAFGRAEGERVVQGEEEGGMAVAVLAADGVKCARCWKYAPTVGADREHPELCARCVGVVSPA